MNKEIKNSVELRKELLKNLKSFNGNDFSKEEEILILSYLLNLDAYLSDTTKHRDLTTPLLRYITKLENELDVPYDERWKI